MNTAGNHDHGSLVSNNQPEMKVSNRFCAKYPIQSKFDYLCQSAANSITDITSSSLVQMPAASSNMSVNMFNDFVSESTCFSLNEFIKLHYLNNLHDNNTLTDNLMNVTYGSPSECEMVAAAFGQIMNVLNNYSAAPQHSLNAVFDRFEEPTYMRMQREENCFCAVNLSSADDRHENVLMTDLDNSRQSESAVEGRNESIRIAGFNHAEI